MVLRMLLNMVLHLRLHLLLTQLLHPIQISMILYLLHLLMKLPYMLLLKQQVVLFAKELLLSVSHHALKHLILGSYELLRKIKAV